MAGKKSHSLFLNWKIEVCSFEVRIGDNHEVDFVITATNICMTKSKICAVKGIRITKLNTKVYFRKRCSDG